LVAEYTVGIGNPAMGIMEGRKPQRKKHYRNRFFYLERRKPFFQGNLGLGKEESSPLRGGE